MFAGLMRFVNLLIKAKDHNDDSLQRGRGRCPLTLGLRGLCSNAVFQPSDDASSHNEKESAS